MHLTRDRMDRARRWAPYAAVVLVGGAVAIFIAYRALGPGAHEIDARAHQREIATSIQEAQTALRPVPVARLDSFGSLAQLRDHVIGAAAASPAPAGDPEARRALLTETADLIFYRFIQDSPGEYRAWRESTGWRMKDADAMRREGIARDYEYWFDEPYPGDENLVQAFDRLWAATLSLRGEASRPVAIAADGGVEIAFGEIDRAWLNPPPKLSGMLPADVWEGKRQGGLSRNWFTDPGGGVRAELGRLPRLPNAPRDTVPTAVVGVVLEMSAGDRYPFSFSYYRDSTGVWRLWRANIHNIATDRFVQLEF